MVIFSAILGAGGSDLWKAVSAQVSVSAEKKLVIPTLKIFQAGGEMNQPKAAAKSRSS